MDRLTDRNEQLFGCTPMVVYFAMGIIILLVGIITSAVRGSFNLSSILMQLASLLIFSGLIYLVCRWNLTVAWVIVAIVVILNLAASVAGMMAKANDM